MPRVKKEELQLCQQTSSLLTGINKNPGIQIPKPFTKEIFLTEVYITGLQYVRGIKRLAQQLSIDDEVKLVREPDNEYDDLAIMIKNQDGAKLGYVPRVKNEIISHLLDAGKLIVGRVKSIKFDADEDRNVDRALTIVINIYLVE